MITGGNTSNIYVDVWSLHEKGKTGVCHDMRSGKLEQVMTK